MFFSFLLSFGSLKLGIIFTGGLLSLISQKNNYTASVFGGTTTVLGSSIGIFTTLKVLITGSTIHTTLPWQMPFGSFSFLLDPLSAFFAFIIFLISLLSSIYGFSYFKAYFKVKTIGSSWFMFNALAGSMVLVCLANNGLFFLLSWELMAISSFFLVAFEGEKASVRKASWTYLIASHIGTTALFLMFILYAKYAGSMDFSHFKDVLSPTQTTIVLILSIIGFGTKAGIIPLHVWLPKAHPVAPSHVSALMSGVMIKTGIYALIRIISFNQIPEWLGYALLTIGVISGIVGVLFAIAQHDLKQLLAYHSVENIGIIFIGLGVGFIGLGSHNEIVAILGFTGGILHIMNHAIFKSLLFLGAGSVLHATHTLEIDQMGGLLKKMPKTGFSFLIGSVAIAGLPPFNGFVSEFLIYLGMFIGVLHFGFDNSLVMVGGIISLALIGGLATACFTKAFGTVFLGEPRTLKVKKAKEVDSLMTYPMMILAGLSVLIGIFGPIIIKLLNGVIKIFVHSEKYSIKFASDYLVNITEGALILFVLVAFFMLLRYFLLKDKSIKKEETWGCGYNLPSTKMQYSSSSFAQPITDLFHFVLQTKKKVTQSNSYFQKELKIETETDDVVSDKIYRPVFLFIKKIFSYFSVIQQGKIQSYILYLVLTLLFLLIWNMR